MNMEIDNSEKRTGGENRERKRGFIEIIKRRLRLNEQLPTDNGIEMLLNFQKTKIR